MTKAEDMFSKHREDSSEDLRQLYLEGSWDTDEVHAVRQLRSTLTNYQLQAFEFAEWMFYGPRATGRTYMFITLAICKALEMPNQWIPVHDHYSTYPIYFDYMKEMLWRRIKELPIQAKFEVQTRNHYLYLKYINNQKDTPIIRGHYHETPSKYRRLYLGKLVNPDED